MTTYTGSKFRPTGETYTTTNRYGETIVRDKFAPTTGYLKWLEEQKQEKKDSEIKLLRTKLQYQFDTYGEVDELDFNEYKYKMKLYYGIIL